MTQTTTEGTAAMEEQPPQRHVFVVFTNSEPGRDDEFNEWYDSHHLREILEVDGFVWGQRFALHPDQRPAQMAPPWKYLTLYEATGDVNTLHERIAETRSNRLQTSALKQDHVAWVFSYVGERAESA